MMAEHNRPASALGHLAWSVSPHGEHGEAPDHYAQHQPNVAPTAKLLFGSFLWGNVTIGEHAVLLPLSVVYMDVPPRAIVRGNPARIIDLACDCGAPLDVGNHGLFLVEVSAERWALHSIRPDIVVICPSCGTPYDGVTLTDEFGEVKDV